VVFKNNVEATYHVLEECVRANVKRYRIKTTHGLASAHNTSWLNRFIFASTNHTQNGSMCADPSKPGT